MPDEPLPDGAGIDQQTGDRRLVGVCRARPSRRATAGPRPTPTGYGIRLGLHLVKGIGEAEGEALDAELARGGPFTSLADLVARTELPEEIVERLIRGGALDSLGEPRRKLLWQLREVAGSRAQDRAPDRSTQDGEAARSPPATDRCARPTATVRARTAGRLLRDPVARRAPPGDRAVPAGARSAGRSQGRRARGCASRAR